MAYQSSLEISLFGVMYARPSEGQSRSSLLISGAKLTARYENAKIVYSIMGLVIELYKMQREAANRYRHDTSQCSHKSKQGVKHNRQDYTAQELGDTFRR